MIDKIENIDKIETIVILDYGSQYTQLIARRIRKLNVHSVILSCESELTEVEAHNPKGIILSGGPSSVYDEHAPKLDPRLLKLGVPVLGICYGLQILVQEEGGEIKPANRREYGNTSIEIKKTSLLFKDIELRGVGKDFVVWMSHGDHIEKLPLKYDLIAESSSAIAAIENPSKQCYGIQFHPEVAHTQFGEKMIHNFLFEICHVNANWTMPSFIQDSIQTIKKTVGDKKVLLGLSGGVDSTTLAVLLHKAIGDQLTCVFVDNGLMRQGEVDKVEKTFNENFKIHLKTVRAKEQFLSELKEVNDPEQKRKIIGKIFLDVFFNSVESVKDFDFLAQGTLYPDVIESVSTNGPSQAIKTHHNRVGQVMDLIKQGRVIEPFQELFKDEVRAIARELNMPNVLIDRHPFPGPGLAIRILGEVTESRLDVLRRADSIVIDEIKKAGLYNELWQCFAVLLPIRSVGVMGDKRTYGYTIAIRAVTSVDGMTADYAYLPKEVLTTLSNRIIGEIEEVNRVVLDISSKPPATIEWE